LFWL